jgi:curli biogenesis system outer membrane secretion channel CsgG
MYNRYSLSLVFLLLAAQITPSDDSATAGPQNESSSSIASDYVTAYPQEIAVNNLTANGIDSSEAIALTDILRSSLGRTGHFQVMERSKMNEILREQGFQQSGACDETSCVVEMGQFLGVYRMVVGNVGKIGKTYTVNVRLVDVSTGKIIREITELHKGDKDILGSHVMPRVAQKLSGTYKNRSAKSFWMASSIVAASTIGAGAIYLYISQKEKQSEKTSDIKVTW